MNYRHAFHAGNFADVFKHALLTRLLVYLTRKDAPLRYIDTHAGIGLYDLSSSEAQRTGEWREGIGRLCDATLPPACTKLLEPYLAIVREIFPPDGAAGYPGSPLIAAKLLRRSDKLMLCELHPQDARTLNGALGRDRRVKIMEMDGYGGLNAFVPPPERRGLVLMDPPFEQRDEFNSLSKAFLAAYAKWPTGVYALWYPLKAPAAADRFCAALVDAGVRRVLRAEIETRRFDPDGPLGGCGLVVVNPTFGFDEEARMLLDVLTPLLATGDGAVGRVEWLTGE